MSERRIALFIDFENLVTNTGITAAAFDLKPSLDALLEKGKVIFRRAYCDWSRFHEAKAGLHSVGVELVDVPPSTRSGKNGADMRLVIDALELCYAREHIDTFVIASGDSDFCPLAYKLRENDRLVIGLAVREATSPLFVKACDEFIYLRASPRRDELRAAGPQRGRSEHRPPRPEGQGSRRQAVVPEIARQVLASVLSKATGPVNPSLIKETIIRRQPDFDVKDHGFATFSRLLDALEKEGLCAKLTQGRQTYVVASDAAKQRPEQDAGDSETGEQDAADVAEHDGADDAHDDAGPVPPLDDEGPGDDEESIDDPDEP